MKTFAAFKAAIRQEVFPNGEAENLVIAHDKDFVDAMIDLQRAVECLQVNNTLIVPQCATYFQCGLTVFEAPRGRIRKVSAFERVDSDCTANVVSDINWCNEARYVQVDYMALEKSLDKTLRCKCSTFPLVAAMTGCDGLDLSTIFGRYYGKQLGRCTAPTDENMGGLPILPMGFHYGQSSTDGAHRARSGFYALQHNRLYVAPWIQSTEVLVVEYDGLKRDWQPTDLVDDDPMLSQAVAAYLRFKHFKHWEVDMALAAVYEAEYNEARANLFDECREETRLRSAQSSHSRASQMSLKQQATGTYPTTSTTTPTTTTTTTTVALPTAPIITGLSYHQGLVGLAFIPGTGVLGQQVWRSVDGADYTLLSTVAYDATEFEDLETDTISFNLGAVAVCYKVRGQNSAGFSQFSNVMCQTLEA